VETFTPGRFSLPLEGGGNAVQAAGQVLLAADALVKSIRDRI
jgi:hypothetical protein